MSTFPGSIVSFTNPSSANFLNSPPHSTQHATENDEIVAVETKLGIGASTPTSGTYLHGTGTGTSSWDTLVINRAFAFFAQGTVIVANDVSWNPISPQAVTAIKLWAYCKTAPVGASLTLQVYNVTQAHAVASVSITTGNTSANTSSMTNASIAAGDVLRFDITNVGSSTNGADVSIVLEATQP